MANQPRSDCPTSLALETLGDEWSLLILRDIMFKGKRSFGELAASAEGISTHTLTRKLRALEGNELLVRTQSGRRTSYALTERSIALAPVMVEIILWSLGTDSRASPPPFMEDVRRDKQAYLNRLMSRLQAEHLS